MYRMAVFPLDVPPLRERVSDVLLLAQHFLKTLNTAAKTSKQFSSSIMDALRAYKWPGNVRELKNTVERSFILADDLLDLDLPITLPAARAAEQVEAPRAPGLHVPIGSSLDEAERSLIEVTLDYCQGDKRKTANVLGCSLKTLYNKLNSYARLHSEDAIRRVSMGRTSTPSIGEASFN
jgi:DNA-binding NtrC family response regulator